MKEIRKGKKYSIMNPRLPFNLQCEDGAYLIGCLLSDGTIYIDKKARGITRLKYSSSDTESTERFIEKLNNIFGTVHIQIENNGRNAYLKVGSSAVSKAFIRVGVPVGNKTSQECRIPCFIKSNNILLRAYFQAIFSDE